ncbi:uncharacterized protein RCC_06774 [Ramularia collo-cygni]|uniref:GPI anchored serine-threonine rich protein n=1 Tax=Ramularia collo-cygni TaxID=112498 RepID=A0A2D3VDN2_9PEZI|nr:uncharacterized protein RCC_06774 [Ramularia collo-cygni]CZT20914.1 uncharacterized protein RCC_06774 [Ramularia collo-cygni]
MHVSAFLALAVASLSAAQSTTGTLSGCGSQVDLIISTCLSTTQPQLQACTANDWDCLCAASETILTCYNNCPSSPDRFGHEQTKVANCNAASAYGTATKATATASSTGSSSSVAATTTSTASESSTMTDSASASSATASETGAAVANAAVPAGGILAAMFGLAALL